mgnify:CR=1 FL=1
MEPILLNHLLEFSIDDYDKIRVKFNQINEENAEPKDVYQNRPDEINNNWLFWRKNRRYFSVGQIAVCLVDLKDNRWLLTTIKEVTKELSVKNGINYIGKEIDKFKPYFGRVIIKFHKTSRVQVFKFGKVQDKLEVIQILPTVYDGDDFTGYENVCLSFIQLEAILKRGKRDWLAALKNQKAVYLITDKNNGKLYVGSATGKNGMLLQRWGNYIATGHGGNKELIELVKEKGIEYIRKYFQYSILENYNMRTDDDYVLQRESWWKEILQSRKFGYNAN